MDVIFLALLFSLPVLLLLSGWGGVGFGLLVLLAGGVWVDTIRTDTDLVLADSPYALAVVYLLGINAAVLIGRCGALLGRVGARRPPALQPLQSSATPTGDAL